MLFPLPYIRFKPLAADGLPVPGGWVYSYAPGTSTPKATYSDPDLLNANDNPLELDANGEALIYLATGGYKLNVKDADLVQLDGWPIDNINYTASMVGLGNVTNEAQIAKSIGTAKGDLIGFSASATPLRVAVGTNGKVVTADSTASVGWSWQTSGMSLVSTTSVTGASTATIDVESGKRYRLVAQLLQNTNDSYHYITFNSDAGNNYSYANVVWRAAGSAVATGSATSSCAVTDNSGANYYVKTANEAVVVLEFGTWVSNVNNVLVSGYGSWVNGLGFISGISVAGMYTGAAELSAISYSTVAGTMTGTLTLYAMN
jgi:hypothetical protein